MVKQRYIHKVKGTTITIPATSACPAQSIRALFRPLPKLRPCWMWEWPNIDAHPGITPIKHKLVARHDLGLEARTQEVVHRLAVIKKFMKAYENPGQQMIGARELSRLKLKWCRSRLPGPRRRIVSGARPFLRYLSIGVTATARLGGRPKNYDATQHTLETEARTGPMEDCAKANREHAQHNTMDNAGDRSKRWRRLVLNARRAGEPCRADRQFVHQRSPKKPTRTRASATFSRSTGPTIT